MSLVEARTVFDKGSHRPIVITAEDDETEEHGSWVLKLQENDNVNESWPKLSVVRELAGAEMCALLGIRTPAIGLLRLAADCEAVATSDYIRSLLRLNRGKILFCSRFVPNATDWPRGGEHGADARSALRAAAVALAYLDVFLLHDDRTVERPNALLADQALWAIDHGNIVAKLHSDSGAHGVVAFPRIMNVLRNHFCIRAVDPAVIRSYEGTLENMADRAASIPDDAIHAAHATWPEELDSERGTSDIAVRTLMRDFLLGRRDVARQLVGVMRDCCKELP